MTRMRWIAGLSLVLIVGCSDPAESRLKAGSFAVVVDEDEGQKRIVTSSFRFIDVGSKVVISSDQSQENDGGKWRPVTFGVVDGHITGGETTGEISRKYLRPVPR